MAIFHLQLSNRTRKSFSRLPHVMLDYYLREGKFQPQNFGDRWDDLRYTGKNNFPAWAHGSAHEFFLASYNWERTNGRYAYVINMSLPRELLREQQLCLTEDFLNTHLHDKPHIWVLHEPMASDGQLNPHIHIVFHGKIMDGHNRDAKQFFKQFNRQNPGQGGGEVDLFWHKRSTPERVRESWAVLTNYYLEKSGHEERINHRSLFRQGIAREPARQFQGPGDPVNYTAENAIAAAAWEDYKTQQGFKTDTTSRTWMIDHLYQRAHREIPTEERKRQRERILAQRLSRLERTIHALRSYAGRLQVEREQEEALVSNGKTPTLLMRKRQQRLLEEKINIPRTQDGGAWGHASRVRIFEDEFRERKAPHEREV